MPCCKLLIFLVFLLLVFIAIGFIYLYFNNFRIKYLDLKFFFKGAKKPSEVGKYYDEWFESYEKTYGDTIQSYRSERLEVLHDYIMNSIGIKDGMHILDAGCGVCGPAIYFAQKLNITIDALTISEKQAQQAFEKVSKTGLNSKINVKKGDYHLLDKLYPENYFDIIIYLEAYGHAQNHFLAMKAARKVLKKGGYLYIKDYFKKDMPQSILQKRLIKMGLKNMDNIYHYHTPDLYHTIYIMRKLNFELLWMGIPQIPEWDKNKVIQSFHEQNNILFYNGKDELFDQSNGRFIVDPYEMMFLKR